jgi:DNA recombination protein RmuC
MNALIAFVIGAFAIGLALGIAAVALWARDALGRERAAAEEKLGLVERTQVQWEEHLKALTGDTLAQSTTSLLELADAKLAPIKETLDQFGRQAAKLEETRLTAVTAVRTQMQQVAEGQERLRSETGNLVTALRAPHVRGRWGEVQLKRVVELAGMVPHCDFVEQATDRDEEGRLVRPDMVVRLPGGKSLVVDSKTPLDAYLDAVEATDATARGEHLARHARLVREHMTKLGQKRYWERFEPTPDFVVMFMADEGFFRAALDHDPALIDAGADAGVFVASPTTLIPLLRTMAHVWQQDTMAQNVREIERLGRDLYKRLGVFAAHFGRVGKSLDAAVGHYNSAVGSLEKNVLSTARKFPEHGVTGEELADVPVLEHKVRAFVAPELQPAEHLVELPQRAVDAA